VSDLDKDRDGLVQVIDASTGVPLKYLESEMVKGNDVQD
jgi:hypothetical protein